MLYSQTLLSWNLIPWFLGEIKEKYGLFVKLVSIMYPRQIIIYQRKFALREWISHSNITLKTKSQMFKIWNAMRSPFQAKHISNSMFMRICQRDVMLEINDKQR